MAHIVWNILMHNQPGLHVLQDTFCANMLREAESFDRAGLPAVFQDLFMEQGEPMPDKTVRTLPLTLARVRGSAGVFQAVNCLPDNSTDIFWYICLAKAPLDILFKIVCVQRQNKLFLNNAVERK